MEEEGETLSFKGHPCQAAGSFCFKRRAGSMKPFGWIHRTWVLTLTVGLTGAACATHKSIGVGQEVTPPSTNK